MSDSSGIYLVKDALNTGFEVVSPVLRNLGIPILDTVLKQGQVNLESFLVSAVKSESIPLHCNLAASLGKLDKESIEKMDEKSLILIATIIKSLEKATSKNFSFETVASIFNQTSLIERVGNAEINKSDKLIKDRGTSAFKFDGSPDAPIVKEVATWFINLLGQDKNIVTDTKIDIQLLADIVAASGAIIDSFEALPYKKEYHEKTVVDVGLLRFPDLENPFVQLYRIQLTVWSDCSGYLLVQEDKSGITGQFNTVKFKPRESVISDLKEETKAKVIAEAKQIIS